MRGVRRLPCTLVVRDSCGRAARRRPGGRAARLGHAAEPAEPDERRAVDANLEWTSWSLSRLHRCQHGGRLLARAARHRADPHHPEPARAARASTASSNSLKLPQPPPPLRFPRNSHDFTDAGLLGLRRRQMDRGGELRPVAPARRRRSRRRSTRSSTISPRRSCPTATSTAGIIGREPDKRWTNLRDNHELYYAGHLLEGAIAYFQATGRRRLLDIMERYVDHIASDVRPRRRARSAAIAATRRSSWR